jgi:hypothetical protein
MNNKYEVLVKRILFQLNKHNSTSGVRFINYKLVYDYDKSRVYVDDKVYPCRCPKAKIYSALNNTKNTNEEITFSTYPSSTDIHIFREETMVFVTDYEIRHKIIIEYALDSTGSVYYPFGNFMWPHSRFENKSNTTFDKIAISSIVIGTLFHEIGHSVEADVNTRDIKPLSPNINVYEKNDKKELFGYMPFSTEGFSRIEFPIIKNGIVVNKIGSLCFSNGNITNGFSLHGSIPIPRTTSMIITTDTMYDTDYDATIVYADLKPTGIFGVLYIGFVIVDTGKGHYKWNINKYLNIYCLLNKSISTVNIGPTAGFGFCKKNNEYIRSSQFADFSLVIRKSDFKKCLYS